MSWDRLLQNDRSDMPIRERIKALFAEQRESWRTLRDGEAALTHLQRKTLTDGGESVIVQVNPARRRSTLAKTDAKAVAARACFLCPENMPPEERGIAFEDLVLLPNPFPILPLHCTVAERVHRPQQLTGRIGTLLQLAHDLGPDLAALYNGPRCGASAPDHFHLQAANAEQIPILAQLPSRGAGHPVTAGTSFGRNMLIFYGSDTAQLEAQLRKAIDALRRIESTAEEPMLNLLAHYDGSQFVVVLFPRAAHRPACYFASGAEQLLISPAVFEMCGVLVATEPDHYARIDTAMARSIYEEVCLGGQKFEQLVATMI